MRHPDQEIARHGVTPYCCALLLLLIGSCASTRDEAPFTIQDDAVTIDDISRDFSYFIPTTTDNQKLPIVIYLHGYGDNKRHILGEGLVKSASSIWMDVAEREHFLVLYPLGTEGSGQRARAGWNDCRLDSAGAPTLDDIKFLRELIDFAVDELNGERGRVFVTGMSNGGHMAMRTAIDMAEEVAAIATIASQLPKNSQCARPSRPVPILMMLGTDDPILPFDGGPIAEGRGDVLSARETVDTWVQWNELEDVQVRSDNVPNIDADDDSRIVSHVRERSTQGDSVVFHEILGGGHTEPSRSAIQGPLLQRVLGNQNNDIEMADAVWDFFKTRSR